jgi:hypothetical protein
MTNDTITALEGRVPADYRKGGNCGVLAVAICAGVSFEKAWKACRMRKGSKGATCDFQRETAMKTLGVKFDNKRVMLRRGRGFKAHYVQPTLKVFARDWTTSGVTYMVTLSRHVVTLKDGIVIDQAGAAPVEKHWTRNKRVRRSMKILEGAHA